MSGRWGRRMRTTLFVVAVAVAPGQAGLAGSEVPAPSDGPPAVRFVDITSDCGVDFIHRNGSTGEKYAMELIGSGGGLLDFDGDGDLDLYLVNGGRLPGVTDPDPYVNALYENLGFPREEPSGDALRVPFRRVPDAAGAADTTYGMGCSVGDFDNDGDPDLYVTNYGPNRLYRNDGGRFVDVAAIAGVDDPRWGASAAFVDIDGDGLLDLYVCNYFRYRLEDHEWWGLRKEGYRTHGGPASLSPDLDTLYRNRGDGTFEDVSESSGIRQGGETYALGVIAGDLDDDGDVDLYVANDTQPNWLFLNAGDGTFVEDGMLAGVSYDQSGKPQAGMGVEAGDVDGDGLVDLICTNFSMETNTLYRGEGSGMFVDGSFEAGLGEATLPKLGFGIALFDLENDRDPDLFIANGHIHDVVHLYDDGISYRQENQLFLNDGRGTFAEAGDSWGAIVRQVEVSRAAIVGDLDNDGDPDLIVTNVGTAPQILRNVGGNVNAWTRVQLAGGASNRDGYGAEILVTAGGVTRRYQARVTASYLASQDPRILVGLGSAEVVDRIEVRWPSGLVDVVEDVPARHTVLVTEAKGGQVLPKGLASVGWAMTEGDW